MQNNSTSEWLRAAHHRPEAGSLQSRRLHIESRNTSAMILLPSTNNTSVFSCACTYADKVALPTTAQQSIHFSWAHSCEGQTDGGTDRRTLLRYTDTAPHIRQAVKITQLPSVLLPSVLWRCWLGGRKGIRPVKTEWWGAGVVICLELGADLHMAQLMPLLLTVSCFSKIQIGFTFLVPAHLGSPGQRAVKRVCVCVYLHYSLQLYQMSC